MITAPALAGKRFAVLGLARSGLAAAESLLASGAEVTAWDRQEDIRSRLEGRARIDDPMDIDLTGFDGVVASPGVPLNSHPIAGKAASAGVPIIGDIELFALARPHLPAHRVIGITGTNGKSTTTALVHHLLSAAGVPTLMGGNIGLPILDQDPLPAGGIYVLELSSYQLDLTANLACDAAALTNITPDHLDRYDGFEAYCRSKAGLFAMQFADQFAVFGCADAPTRAIREIEASRRPAGRAVCCDPALVAALQPGWRSLQGPHNLQNAAIAAWLCAEMGVSNERIAAGMANFSGLAHRMEYLGEAGGVTFINDSKATNTASTAPALAAYPPAAAPRIHWIVGGLPKEDGLGDCESYLGNVAVAYTIGDAGPRFAELLEGRVAVERCEMMCTAVQSAVAAARPGDVVLLSPACASFDQFRDYEARGDAFREVITSLTGATTERPGVSARSAA